MLATFGLVRGASHSEYIVGPNGELWFIETSGRVGGANIAEMTEAATGINLWSEWAKVELLGEGGGYVLPPRRNEFGGVIISLSRFEHPDLSSFTDPEIVEKLDKPWHVGLVVRSTSSKKVQELLGKYMERIRNEYHASLPSPTKATS